MAFIICVILLFSFKFYDFFLLIIAYLFLYSFVLKDVADQSDFYGKYLAIKYFPVSKINKYLFQAFSNWTSTRQYNIFDRCWKKNRQKQSYLNFTLIVFAANPLLVIILYTVIMTNMTLTWGRNRKKNEVNSTRKYIILVLVTLWLYWAY